MARTFDTASELATEASRRTGKRVPENTVEAIVGYQPAYDGHDLQDVLDHLGWRKRPERRQASQLQKEVEKTRRRLGVPSPPPDFKTLHEKLYESVDALLKAWLGRSWVEARNAVRKALFGDTSLDEARQRLRESFPHAPPPPEEAVLVVRRLWKQSHDWEPLWVRCWREAERLSRWYVNRGSDLAPENESSSNVSRQGFWTRERGKLHEQEVPHTGGDHQQAQGGGSRARQGDDGARG